VSLPERAAVIFELCVAGMLLVLGARAIVGALGAAAAVEQSHLGPHLGPHGRIHPVVRTLVQRQLTVGLVHSFAGSGAITALAFAELPGAGARLLYMTLSAWDRSPEWRSHRAPPGSRCASPSGRAVLAAAWFWSPAPCRSPSV
jgi:hypothetical protein